jgi:hypothetical protein
MRYVANPVEVDAFQIVTVGDKTSNGLTLLLDNGETVHATSGMVARMDPKPGDYWVVQVAGGYIYLNPRDVFERKYRPVSGEQASSA